MSMLLKALESVEQDRKKKELKKKEGFSTPQFDDAKKSESSGFATPPDDMSLEFEPGGGLDFQEKEQKAFVDEGIETLEFIPVEPTPQDLKSEPQEPQTDDGSNFSGIAFEMVEVEKPQAAFEPEPPAEGDSKFSNLAFAIEEAEKPQAAFEPEPPAEGGSKFSNLAFAMDEALEPPAAMEPDPPAAMEPDPPAAMEPDPPAAMEPVPPAAKSGGIFSGLAFDMDEVEEPATANGGSKLSGLAFDMDEVEEPASANGDSMLSDLAFGLGEVGEPPAANGGSVLSDLAFDLDEVEEPASANGNGMLSGLAFAMDDVIQPPATSKPEPPAAKGGSKLSGPAFEMEEIIEPSAVSKPEPPAAKVGSKLSGPAYEMEEIAEVVADKDETANPVAESPPAEVDEDDEDDDVTNPVVTEQSVDNLDEKQAAMAETDPPEDAAEDGWDASGDLDKTAAFNPAFLDAQPKESKPKKLYGDDSQDKDPEDQSTKYGTKEHTAKQESLQQKAKTIFEATAKSGLPLKQIGLVVGGILVVGGGAFFAYQTFFAMPTSQFPKQPPRMMRPIAINPAAQKPGELAQNSPATNDSTSTKESDNSPQENLQPNSPIQDSIAVAQDFNKASSVVREDTTFEPVSSKPEPAPKPEEVAHDILLDAQTAYYSGEVEDSSKLFKKVLRKDKHNRDAMMGLAAVAVRNGEHDQASGFYQNMLRENPQDSLALAGLIGLRAEVDPLGRESQIKSLLRSEPNAPHLHFALGSLYAVQKRWGDAQKSFFEAYSLSATNPDYAFNLAVSMDHLGHVDVAKKYYQTALALLTVSPGNFNKSLAEDRLADFRQLNMDESAPEEDWVWKEKQ
ncbi:MAG: tetratricopeptide repeat protein [Magnetococcales bacterium]|nr:tetratricopeptide repeat protein [Magnetococcales bacterium]